MVVNKEPNSLYVKSHVCHIDKIHKYCAEIVEGFWNALAGCSEHQFGA